MSTFVMTAYPAKKEMDSGTAYSGVMINIMHAIERKTVECNLVDLPDHIRAFAQAQPESTDKEQWPDVQVHAHVERGTRAPNGYKLFEARNQNTITLVRQSVPA